MSGAEGKADVQVTRLGHVFPFGGSSGSPLPNLTQCCRFSIPERLPLQPFRQDRLPRLPLPPSIMAATSKTVALTGTSAFPSTHGQQVDIDPQKKIIQLEKNITFLQESHVTMLKCLHEEISDLKQKNRELQFQLVTGYPARLPESVKEEVSSESEKVESLEKELGKLRIALKEALSNNATLVNELETVLKREQYITGDPSRIQKEHAGNSRGGRPRGPSPEMDDYGDTLKQIQRAAGARNLKSSDPHHADRHWNKGGSGFMESRRGQNYHHHMMQRSHDTRHHYHHQQQQQHLPRLPRLSLHNQLQNYLSHNQYEIQYQQQHASAILPSLKQSDQNKARKSRGPPQQAKVADKLYNR